MFHCMCGSHSAVSDFATPWTVSPQTPVSMEFSRQEYWSGLPFLPPEGLPDLGIKPKSPASSALAGRFFTTEPPVIPLIVWMPWHVKLYAKLLQSYPTLCDPLDCNPPGSSVHGILQARILEWVVMPSSRGPSQPRDWTHVSYVFCIGRQILYHCTTWDAAQITNIYRIILNF